MNFEFLSIEILFEIFDYLDDIHILQIFYDLNHHFNEILLAYFRVSPQLNLQSITKSNFDNICKYLIPSITDKIHSLRLSNDNDTPQQIDLFLSYGLTLYKFRNLKSLSLHSMHSEVTIKQIMIEWQYPSNLTHLHITECKVLNDWNIIYSLINNIWSLPKLTHCQLDINVIDENYSIIPHVVSFSLECLSIRGLSCNSGELIHLFEQTPLLRYLDINICGRAIDEYMSFPVSRITTLKISYEGPFNILRNLLQNTPYLYHLTMRMEKDHVVGYEWEEIISNHLSKLKIFHLLMIFYPQSYSFDLKELVSTYKSEFWLEEHKWYVQGHCFRDDRHLTVQLYTLPYIFDDYSIPSNSAYISYESYFLNYDDLISYDHVHHFSCISLPTNKYHFHNRFSYIHHLRLILPFHNNFWMVVPTFDQLQKLDISFSYTEAYNQDASFQLQNILERSPRLYSLTIESSIDSLLPLLECTSLSIVKLVFSTCDKHFSHEDCAILSLSRLGKQCEILSINVTHRIDIIYLLKEMPQLRSLIVECLADNYTTVLLSPTKDPLIPWLKRQLPTNCVITRDSSHPDKIQIWIC